MAKADYRISGQLNVVFSDIIITASSKEEVLEKLYKMDVQDIIDECYIEDSDIAEEEVVIETARVHVKVHHVDWDINEDDIEAAREEDPNATEESIRNGIEKEWFLTIDIEEGDTISDFEEHISDALSLESGWCFNDYSYDICPEDLEIFDECFKEN